MSQRVEAAGCLIKVGDQYLIIRRAATVKEAGKLGLPGGAVEGNETLTQTAIRELQEEVNIDLTPFAESMELVRTYDHDYAEDHLVRWNTFKVILDEKPEIDLKDDESSEYMWLNLEEIVARQDELLATMIDLIEKQLIK